VFRLSLMIFSSIACVACSSREVVVVYSPHGPDVGRDYEALFEAEYPHIDLQWLDMGSQEVFNRVSAEKNRPAADVWWGAPSTMFMQAAERGLLAEYTPTWADAVEPAYKDPKNRWYGVYRTPLSVFFNRDRYSREDVPHSWDGLLDPEWDDKIIIRYPPPSGTMRTFIGAIMLREGSDEAGIEWLKYLHAQTKSYPDTPQLLFDQIKRNEDMITVWIMPDAVLQRQRNGYPFDFYLPRPTPVLTEGIAIIENAPHREHAELFYEFVTTREALAYQANEYAKIPTRNDMDDDSLPGWMLEQTIEPMDIDWAAFAENEKQWVDRWKTEVYDVE